MGTRTPLFGRSTPGGVFDYANIAVTPGNVWFVDSGAAGKGDTVGHGSNPDLPFATLGYAFSSDLVGADDVVYVMPGHAETIAAAGGVTMDIDAVTVVGLGTGALRPLFSFSATDSTMVISADKITVRNIQLKSTVNELVKFINAAGASDLTLDAVDVVDPGSTKEALQFILTDTDCDRLEIKNCRHYASTAAASAQKWIELVAVVDAYIHDNIFVLALNDAATSSVINMDANCRRNVLQRNAIHLTGYSASLVSAVIGASGATGLHLDSRIYADVAAVTTINDFPNGASFEVYCSNDLDKNGILDPVVGS
ncbi:MAG: hypothetical protein RJA55_599 [Acidobacteriota bacterium]